MSFDPRVLEDLLAEASAVRVRSAGDDLILEVAAHRSDPRGERLGPVGLRLLGVQAEGWSVEPEDGFVRPSALGGAALADAAATTPSALGAVTFSVNRALDTADLTWAPEARWERGSAEAWRAAPLRLRGRLPPDPHRPGLAVSRWWAATAFAVEAEGRPLSAATWTAQQEQAWRAWADGWPGLGPAQGLGAPTFVALRQGRPEVSPPAPAFEPLASGCPEALLAPLRAWHDGRARQDWARVAEVWFDPDRPAAERARALAALSTLEGSIWRQVEQVEGWWWEGARAGVALRGLRGPLPGRAEGWHFGLRRWEGRWILRSHTTVPLS